MREFSLFCVRKIVIHLMSILKGHDSVFGSGQIDYYFGWADNCARSKSRLYSLVVKPVTRLKIT